jgi:hypothetical protein
MKLCLYCNQKDSAEKNKYKPGSSVDFICTSCSARMLNLKSLGPVDFKRAYIRALFLEDERWINYITKDCMIVPGNRLNRIDNKRDLELKEKLADQIHPDTYLQRRDYYEAWLKAKCCADDCDRICDECHGIKFNPVPYRISKPFDQDVRRFIEKYQRFWLKSEQEKAFKELRGQYDNKRKISDRKSNNDLVWIRQQSCRTRSGLSGKQEKVACNPFEGQEEMFLRP